MLFDFFFGSTVRRDQLGQLGGNPHFQPPTPLPVQVLNGIPNTPLQWREFGDDLRAAITPTERSPVEDAKDSAS